MTRRTRTLTPRHRNATFWRPRNRQGVRLGRRRGDDLKGIDLTLRAGELTLLMGPSGSGKTTLLSILGCILTPTGPARASLA